MMRRLTGSLLFSVGQVIRTRKHTLKTTGKKPVDVKRSITEIRVTSIARRGLASPRPPPQGAAAQGRLSAT